MRRKFIAGNWKMYKEKSQVAEFMDEILEIYKGNEEKFSEMHVGICPPNIYLDYVCHLYTYPSQRDRQKSRMPSCA